MPKISVFNKIFITLFVLLMAFVVWKAPNENKSGDSKYQAEKSTE